MREIEERLALLSAISAETQGEVVALRALIQALLVINPNAEKLISLASTVANIGLEARQEALTTDGERKYHAVRSQSATDALAEILGIIRCSPLSVSQNGSADAQAPD